jgi:hypothetical protein
MTIEEKMRAEIEAAGMAVVKIGPLFGSELYAIVENDFGQFLWSAYRREYRQHIVSLAKDFDSAMHGQEFLF